eukprot:jgi/Undpi1/8811/HiC_scaffold_25.g11273.m1
MTKDSSSQIYALDFDGVICNSQGESSRSGFKALQCVWPELGARLKAERGGEAGDDDAPAWMLDKMRELRPIIETGYENILLARLLVEEGRRGERGRQRMREGEGERSIPSGPEAREELTVRYGLSRDELINAFGQARDEWIETDFEGWLGANSFYEGVREAIAACKGEVYVVTTKQQRFASALLEYAGVKVPLERIFGLGTGPKADVLAELAAKHSGSTLHFFEDRVETLEVVCKDSRLEDAELYLCDWGFNTAAQRGRGEANPRVRVIGTGDIGGALSSPDS